VEGAVLNGSLSSLWPASVGAVYLPGLWSLPLVSLSLPFLSAFFLLSLAGFHHHFGQLQEDLSPLNLGMKYAEQNVKHPPMNTLGGRGGCQCHILLHRTHMVLPLVLAYVSSKF